MIAAFSSAKRARGCEGKDATFARIYRDLAGGGSVDFSNFLPSSSTAHRQLLQYRFLFCREVDFGQQSLHTRCIALPFAQTAHGFFKLPMGDLLAELLASRQVQVNGHHGLLGLEIDLPKPPVFLEGGKGMNGPLDVLAQDGTIAPQLQNEPLQTKGKLGERLHVFDKAFLEIGDHREVGLAVNIEFKLGKCFAHIALIANHLNKQGVNAFDHLKTEHVIASQNLCSCFVWIGGTDPLRMQGGIFCKQGRYEIRPEFHFGQPSEMAFNFVPGDAGDKTLACGTVSKFGFSRENVQDNL
jgi:hypothetical protein